MVETKNQAAYGKRHDERAKREVEATAKINQLAKRETDALYKVSSIAKAFQEESQLLGREIVHRDLYRTLDVQAEKLEQSYKRKPPVELAL